VALTTTTPPEEVTIRDGEAGHRANTTVPTVASNSIKLLIADDDPVTRKLLATTVARWGYDVLESSDGPTALRLLTGEDAPQLAIVDWEMPGLSGIELCRILRAQRRSPYVYVLLLTGREGKEHVITGLTAGADDYIRKPFDAHELEVRLRAGSRIVELQQRLLETQRALERRARFDFLTDAHNRETILEAVHDELARNQRTQEPFSVILFDVDRFKSVNDTHGHAVGDEVLREAVRRIKDTARPYDVVGRWGGEEFLILAPGCAIPQGALVAERLKVALASAPFETSAGPLRISASFGVSSTKQGYTDVDKLIEAADKALYEAKKNGRNRVEVAQGVAGNDENLAITQNAPARSSDTPANDTSLDRPSMMNGEPVTERDAGRTPLHHVIPVFDHDVFNQLRDLIDGHDISFLNDLFANYLETAEKNLGLIRDTRDPFVAKRAAHTLKGSSLNVGAAAVARICKEFEEQFASNDQGSLQSWLHLLQAEVDRVRESYPNALRRLVTSSV
jgi:diguanylate cyclase (GGDEF)-like protein